ncbi:MFS general substrate transporter [Thozetella sp. PMI_491]|nr:MFS general substrate transporter [Thozetella sp. PMI_491]
MPPTDTTATGIQLQELQGTNLTQRDAHDRSRPQQPASDPVLEASRLADSDVPDGGYGWVVIACCAVVTWWFVGTSYSWGVIQAELVKRGVSSPPVLSFVGSMGPTMMASFAIINGRVIRIIGVRLAASIGIGCLGLAEILAGFTVDNVSGLFVTAGAMVGIGFGLCFMVVTVTPSQYFSKKRGIANGIVFAGGGFGGATISFGLDYLIQALGTAWGFRILGLMILATGLPAAWFIRERVPIRTGPLVEWRLFKSFTFTSIFAAGAIGTFPLFVPPFFLPLYARSLGLSSSTGAGLLAAFNLSSAVGRILCGFLCDSLGSLNTLFVALILCAMSMLALWPASTSLPALAIFVVINGLSNGGFFSTVPTVVSNVFGSARVSVAMAMTVTGWGGGYMMGAPIAGYILDAYGGEQAGLQSYRPAMLYAGSMAAVAAILVLAVRLHLNKRIIAKL